MVFIIRKWETETEAHFGDWLNGDWIKVEGYPTEQIKEIVFDELCEDKIVLKVGGG